MKKKILKEKDVLNIIFKRLKISKPLNKKNYNSNLIENAMIDSLQIMILHSLLEEKLSVKIKNFEKQVGEYKIVDIHKFIKKNLKN